MRIFQLFPKKLLHFSCNSHRRKAVSWYCLEINDVILEQWVVIYARNYFVLAASAPVKLWRLRFEWLCAIAEAEEIRSAVGRVKAEGRRDRTFYVTQAFVRYPKVMGVIYFVLKRIQRILRGN